MMPENRKRLAELFEQAMALLPEKRSRFLVEACAGEDVLREELQSLVKHHEQATADFLKPLQRLILEPDDQSPPEPAHTLAAAGRFSETPSDLIVGYEITKELHRGGQGVVFQAIQKSTKRKVALKVMLEGPFASEKTKRRFEREIELVASLHHPNIVSVFDSGVSHGKYWFAMDYIRGRPLDQYAAGKELSIEDSLRLFAKICEAVNYAHQRGVIHRDLKPGNILVDEQGEPHVLDFGLAKVAGAEAFGDSRPMLVSITGQVMGTLPYMSPEQAKGDSSQIDIRSDVYSLGVILYEMLTGKYPYDVVGPLSAVLKNIIQIEARKPSTIRRKINDELDTIVLKALAKERQRRYQSVGNLSEDIGRFLAGESIEAKRDSGWYVIRKVARRYRVALSVATIGAIAILAAVASTSIYQSRRTSRFLKAFTEGTLRHEAHDYKAAALKYMDAAQQWQKFFAAWYYRGLALYQLHDDQDALQAFQRATELEPNDGRALIWEAMVLFRMGDEKKAIQTFQQYLEKHPEDAIAKEDFAWTLLTASDNTLRDAKKAKKLLGDLKKPWPKSQIAAIYALACAQSGDISEVSTVIKDLPADQPFELIIRAICENAIERRDLAEKDLKDARRMLSEMQDKTDDSAEKSVRLLRTLDQERRPQQEHSTP